MGARERAAERARRVALDEFWTVLVECHGDVPALLRTIASRVVDLVGDGCVLTLVSDDGLELHPEVVLHSSPAVAEAMRTALGTEDVRIGEGIAGSVAERRQPVLLNHLDPETTGATTPAKFLPFVRDHPMQALMIVPLVAGGELIGTLGAVRTESAEPYTPADLRLLEALGERAALAVSEALAAPRSIGAADFEAIYRHNLDGVLLTTPDGHILAANPAACAILRLTERQIVHGGRQALVIPEEPALVRALEERAASGHTRAEITMRRGDGSAIVADVSSTIFTTPDGKVRAAVIFRDVTDRVADRRATLDRLMMLEEEADRDALTGLWNRRGFSAAAEQALATADRNGLVAQFLFMDVDRLKRINDEEGHPAGDDALVAVAAAIRGAIREADVAARLGGDEFVVLTVDTPTEDVPHIMDRIRDGLASHPALDLSVGTAQRDPGSDMTLQDLIAVADREMYQQKVLHHLRRSD